MYNIYNFNLRVYKVPAPGTGTGIRYRVLVQGTGTLRVLVRILHYIHTNTVYYIIYNTVPIVILSYWV